jgi:hypothetical protein
MITPFLIRVIFVLALAYFVWRGVLVLQDASIRGDSESETLESVFATALAVGYWWILAPLVLRLACEGTMVVFRIHEALAEMRDRGERTHEAVIDIRKNTAE